MAISRGFTLAELLIALAILGLIATFTLPKVIQAQQDSRNKAIIKETAASFSQALGIYALKNGGLSSSTGFSALTPYLNYVSLDTSATTKIDTLYGPTSCSAAAPCLHLHNGAILLYDTTVSFGGTSTTNALDVFLDPDGIVDDPKPFDTVWLIVYYNGKVRTGATMEPNTTSLQGVTVRVFNPSPADDPSWFNWN